MMLKSLIMTNISECDNIYYGNFDALCHKQLYIGLDCGSFSGVGSGRE